MSKREKIENELEIKLLVSQLDGLKNDAEYWNLARTYGVYSTQVLVHLRGCRDIQSRGENCTR